MCEGIELTLKLWTSAEPVTWAGRHYSLERASCEPKPTPRAQRPIWTGEAHPALLDATARYAQGWNSTPVSIAELRRRLAGLREACERSGRDFDAIEKTLEIQILIAPDHAGLRAQLGAALALAPDEAPDPALAAYVSGATDELPASLRETWLAGTPEMVIERVRAYAAEGITHFMLWFVDAPDQAGMRLFARDVLPRLG
jgi:alkanesulfonate monooxygenase SsuD/methylene tetrahydromethanopterin reductase-like flavin-dependent oxidoreductase (luciferase family)